MVERATVTAPEMIGLLVWWIVVLAAPAILVSRFRRRPRPADRLRWQARRPVGEQPAGQPAPRKPAAVKSHTRASTEPRLVPPLPADALEPLCRYVDFQRRLELAASELRARLSQLPASRWRIEPYPLTGERRNRFVTVAISLGVREQAAWLSRCRRRWARTRAVAVMCLVRARDVERVEHDVLVVSIDRLTHVLAGMGSDAHQPDEGVAKRHPPAPARRR
jgi:hypothetical protein